VLRVSERRDVSIPAENDAKLTVAHGPALAFHMGMMDGERHAPATPPIVVTINVDEVIEESFPASDPPSWTPGVARPAPVDANNGGSDVEDVRVLRSIPLLDRAAIEAVRQWRYSPLLLNGNPERFVLTVTVSFNPNT
jgi:TonB family protein